LDGHSPFHDKRPALRSDRGARRSDDETIFSEEDVGMTAPSSAAAPAQCLEIGGNHRYPGRAPATLARTCIVPAASFERQGDSHGPGRPLGEKTAKAFRLQKAFIDHFAFSCGTAPAGFLKREAGFCLSVWRKKAVARAEGSFSEIGR